MWGPSQVPHQNGTVTTRRVVVESLYRHRCFENNIFVCVYLRIKQHLNMIERELNANLMDSELN